MVPQLVVFTCRAGAGGGEGFPALLFRKAVRGCSGNGEIAIATGSSADTTR